ncbi:hypothetical protein K1719_045450 [Acacia pycnantha]|nr:hypothetical protein K1719_045450 [Acacia pycnantha]
MENNILSLDFDGYNLHIQIQLDLSGIARTYHFIYESQSQVSKSPIAYTTFDEVEHYDFMVEPVQTLIAPMCFELIGVCYCHPLTFLSIRFSALICTMTEYWVSQGNKWCDFCKIYISNNPSSIRNHELGQRHKDNVAKRLATMRKESAAKEKEEKETARALEQIEAVKEFWKVKYKRVNDSKRLYAEGIVRKKEWKALGLGSIKINADGKGGGDYAITIYG